MIQTQCLRLGRSLSGGGGKICKQTIMIQPLAIGALGRKLLCPPCWWGGGGRSRKASEDKPFAMGHEAGGKQAGGGPQGGGGDRVSKGWACVRRYKQVRWLVQDAEWEDLGSAVKGLKCHGKDFNSKMPWVLEMGVGGFSEKSVI